MSERKKTLAYINRMANTCFWRTHAQQAIDYIEESGGILNAFEFKWNAKARAKMPEAFGKAYPEARFPVIDRNNYLSFVTSGAVVPSGSA